MDIDRQPGPIDLALQRLEKLVPEEASLWCSPRSSVQFGPPADCILQEALDTEADLIVLGVRAAKQSHCAATDTRGGSLESFNYEAARVHVLDLSSAQESRPAFRRPRPRLTRLSSSVRR